MNRPYFMRAGLKSGSFYVYRYHRGFCNSKLIRMGLTEFEAEILVHELNLHHKRMAEKKRAIATSYKIESFAA